jgi:predicted peroxiredoxin
MLKNTVLIFLLMCTTLYSDSDTNSTKSSVKKKTLSGKNLVVFVNSGELKEVGMGFGIALSATKQGANVTIVIGGNAIKYALKEGNQNIYFAKEKTPRELIQKAIKSGATVQLCAANVEEMALDEEEFIEGAKIVISPQIFKKVFEKDTRVISF